MTTLTDLAARLEALIASERDSPLLTERAALESSLVSELWAHAPLLAAALRCADAARKLADAHDLLQEQSHGASGLEDLAGALRRAELVYPEFRAALATLAALQKETA